MHQYPVFILSKYLLQDSFNHIYDPRSVVEVEVQGRESVTTICVKLTQALATDAIQVSRERIWANLWICMMHVIDSRGSIWVYSDFRDWKACENLHKFLRADQQADN